MAIQKKILVPGGTGAMGVYLVPELLRMGYAVDVVSLDNGNLPTDKAVVDSLLPDTAKSYPLRYFKGNFKDPSFRGELLANGYDCIVDFMIYLTAEFEAVHKELLAATDHYIYLSTYRIYANEEHPIKETSPRLLDVATDPAYLATEDYSLYKARGENMLKASGFTNWTAIRPAITYSKRRFQLVTLEADVVIHRARTGKTLLIPAEALDVQATMSWAGDVAKMISRLVLNPSALCEIYSVCTAEHHTWGEIAEYYRDLVGLRYEPIPKEEYLDLWGPQIRQAAGYQLDFDRLFDRIMDNSKILTLAGMEQSELMPLYDGLKMELARLPADVWMESASRMNLAMDGYLATKK